MKAIAFMAKIENGTIKIPKEYQSNLSSEIRVIIVQDEPSKENIKLSKKRSLKAFEITTKDLKFDRDEANER